MGSCSACCCSGAFSASCWACRAGLRPDRPRFPVRMIGGGFLPGPRFERRPGRFAVFVWIVSIFKGRHYHSSCLLLSLLTSLLRSMPRDLIDKSGLFLHASTLPRPVHESWAPSTASEFDACPRDSQDHGRTTQETCPRKRLLRPSGPRLNSPTNPNSTASPRTRTRQLPPRSNRCPQA